MFTNRSLSLEHKMSCSSIGLERRISHAVGCSNLILTTKIVLSIKCKE